MKLVKRTVALVAAGLLALTACSSSDSDPAPEETKTVEAPVKEEDPAPTDEEVYDMLSESLVQDMEEFFDDACQRNGYDWWMCYYDDFEVHSKHRLDIHLSFPGGVDEKELAEEARNWFASFLGWKTKGEEPFPDLNTIVSYGNGLDLGTTRDTDFVKP